MKRFLFIVFVILMTPIYLIIRILEHLIGWLDYFVEPIRDGMINFTEDMTQFWKKILKQKGGKQS